MLAKANTLIDIAALHNFVSKEFVIAYGSYKDFQTAPILAIRVASEHRISTTQVFLPSVFTIDGHDFNNLQFRVLSHLKSSDIILGFPALKQLNVVIHPSLNTFTMGDFTINYDRESSHRISCMIVDSD